MGVQEGLGLGNMVGVGEEKGECRGGGVCGGVDLWSCRHQEGVA